MRLKTNIFLWVFVSTLLPLAVLVLAATTYSERRYRDEVNREMTSRLNALVSEIDRSLYYERQMVLALAGSPDIRQYLPVLERADAGALHSEYFQRTERLSRFLAGLQGVVPNFATLRVLDIQANTLIKVRFGHGNVGISEGIESFPYAEDEIQDPGFAKRLRALAANDLSFIALPESRWDRDGLRGPPMLDAVVPLQSDGKTIGYLMVDFSGGQVDRIVEMAPREHEGKVLIAEINPDNIDRDGNILYDDARGLRLTNNEAAPVNLKKLDGGRLWDAVQRKPYGEFSDPSGLTRTYYMEYLPYSNQLASWVVAVRMNMSEVLAPFDRIRQGILGVAAVALLAGLFLAQLGARTIARPVTEMARGLKRYANGDHSVRVHVQGADEIRQLETSFNYMADTLEHARAERDRAQHMMLQNAKLASIGQMAAGIGHEINNPLNNALSLAKLVKRAAPDNDKVQRDVNSLREEVLRASAIVKGILNFARQVAPEYSRFAIAAWIEETIALVQQEARSHCAVISAGAIDDGFIDGDRGQLQQVLVNLLLNAVQASAQGSAVTVQTARRQREFVICVCDHGPGIDAPTMERVFDPFFSTKAVGEGSGLGLSISLGIVERHGGQLRVENNADGGVTATVILPLGAL